MTVFEGTEQATEQPTGQATEQPTERIAATPVGTDPEASVVVIPAPQTGEPAIREPDIDESGIDEPDAAGAADTAEPESGEPRDSEEPAPAYVVPVVPDVGWEAAPSPRRRWIGRALLAAILVLQALLSLRLYNSVSPAEARFLNEGYVQADRLLHHIPAPHGSVPAVSGSPRLAPVAAALVDEKFGLLGVRNACMVLLLATTALLYAAARRLFNERVALCTAAMFAVTQPVVVLGNLANPSAPALFLYAAAFWVVVRTRDRTPVLAALAAPMALAAAAVKFEAAAYVPVLVLLAAVVSPPDRPWRAVLRALSLAAAIAALAAAALYATDIWHQLDRTTLHRGSGTDSAGAVARRLAIAAGLPAAAALGGMLAYLRRGRLAESPAFRGRPGPGLLRRFALGAVLCAPLGAAAALQIRGHRLEGAELHMAFGLLLAAPMAGLGVTRLIGAHFRYPQLGILLWVVMLCTAIGQSADRFREWPNSDALRLTLDRLVDDRGRYLSTIPDIPEYQQRSATNPGQWTSDAQNAVAAPDGSVLAGEDGYRRAIAEGWFDVVVVDTSRTGPVIAVIEDGLGTSPHYRLLGGIPFSWRDGKGEYRIWVKQE